MTACGRLVSQTTRPSYYPTTSLTISASSRTVASRPLPMLTCSCPEYLSMSRTMSSAASCRRACTRASGSRSPRRRPRGAGGLGVVEPADERGDGVGVLRRERVARTVQVVGRRDDGAHAELGAVGLAHLDAHDLGDGVPLVPGRWRAGEERGLRDRLGRVRGVDGGGGDEEQLAHGAAAPGSGEHARVMHRFPVMKSTGAAELAWSPPTLPAARITYRGRSASKNLCTAASHARSCSERLRPTALACQRCRPVKFWAQAN
ncbi:hypothetical protein BS78_10G211500 [Paspalum vaginatum]|nr:hypothetical protein BS78_10G211500 [Paspalum vaginatum]